MPDVKRVRRAPPGVLSEKPVYMRLMPDERHSLEQLSQAENRSTSSVARLVFIAGIDHYRAKISAQPAQACEQGIERH